MRCRTHRQKSTSFLLSWYGIPLLEFFLGFWTIKPGPDSEVSEWFYFWCAMVLSWCVNVPIWFRYHQTHATFAYIIFSPAFVTCTRFCKILRKKLADEKQRGRKIYHCCLNHPHRRTNAAVLMGAFQILELGKTAEEAYKPFRNISPVMPAI